MHRSTSVWNTQHPTTPIKVLDVWRNELTYVKDACDLQSVLRMAVVAEVATTEVAELKTQQLEEIQPKNPLGMEEQ